MQTITYTPEPTSTLTRTETPSPTPTPREVPVQFVVDDGLVMMKKVLPNEWLNWPANMVAMDIGGWQACCEVMGGASITSELNGSGEEKA